MTDNCIPGAPPTSAATGIPTYVEYAYIRGGGEIPRVTTFGAYPGSSDLGAQVRPECAATGNRRAARA